MTAFKYMKMYSLTKKLKEKSTFGIQTYFKYSCTYNLRGFSHQQQTNGDPSPSERQEDELSCTKLLTFFLLPR